MIELGMPLIARKRLLAELNATPGGLKESVRFQGRLSQFDVRSVRIGMPKYRLSNGRTQAIQEQLLASNETLPRDLFEKDQESELAQSEQHKLLKTLVNEERLYDYFRTHQQEEPLILTALGIVVNGNRRLCAMRELLESDSAKYGHFSNIQVVILPPCEERDLDALEAELQIKEEIRADYSWIAQACMMRRRQADQGYNTIELGQLYGLKPEEVNEQLDLLRLADQYLERIGKPKRYDLVKEDEYAFKALRTQMRKAAPGGRGPLTSSLAFTLIQTAPDGAGRLNTFIPDMVKNIDEISARLSEEFKQPAVAPAPRQRVSASGGDDSVKLLSDDPEESYVVSSAVADPANAETVNAIVIDVVEGAKAKSRQIKRENAVVTSIAAAHTSVAAALLALSASTYKPEVNLHLRSLENVLSQFKAKVKEYDSH